MGIDEIQWQHGHRYLTLVYQIDPGHTRLLWIGQARRVKTVLRFFRWFGAARTQALQFVCSDMWKPYLKVVAKKAGPALHIPDRFHIALNMNKAIDTVRREEVRELKHKGRPAWLTKARWLLLRRRDHRTTADRSRLRDLVRLNLKAVRSMLLREDFEPFWRYRSAHWAGLFLDRWCTQVMRSRIDPMKKVARSLRTHRALLLNWCKARGQISAGAVEGLNNKAKLTTKKAYGFRTYRCLEIALYHTLGSRWPSLGERRSPPRCVAATTRVAPAPELAVVCVRSRRCSSGVGTAVPRRRQRLNALRVVAGFQVSIDGRFWVSTEVRSSEAQHVLATHSAAIAGEADPRDVILFKRKGCTGSLQAIKSTLNLHEQFSIRPTWIAHTMLREEVACPVNLQHPIHVGRAKLSRNGA